MLRLALAGTLLALYGECVVEPWRSFNADLMLTAQREMKSIRRGLQNLDTMLTTTYGTNDLLAEGLQQAVTLAYADLPFTFSALVWDASLPSPYTYTVRTVGAIPYDKCLHSAAQAPASSNLLQPPRHRPCQEGGSIFTGVGGRFGPRRVRWKRIMVFYTPEGAWGPAMVTPAEAPGTREADIGRAYNWAKRRCQIRFNLMTLNLNNFLECILENFGDFQGFTPLRGIAIAVEVPSSGDYSTPGFSSPPGHVVIDPIHLETAALNEPILKHMRLWLLANSPIQIP